MRFINIIPFVALALPFANAIDGDSKTISLDSTCTTRNGWDEIWAEVMQMAESTRDLLQDSKRNNGADFEYLVAQVFKVRLDGGAGHRFIHSTFTQIPRQKATTEIP